MVFKKNVLVNAFLCGIQASKVKRKNYCIIYFNIKTASISEMSTKKNKASFFKEMQKTI